MYIVHVTHFSHRIFWWWFSFCLYQLDICVFLWICLFESIHLIRCRRIVFNCSGSRTALNSACFLLCIHARVTIEIYVSNYSPFHFGMATSLNKAAGFSSSLTMTYLFFIFRAIAYSFSVRAIHTTTAAAEATASKAAACSTEIYVNQRGRFGTQRKRERERRVHCTHSRTLQCKCATLSHCV